MRRVCACTVCVCVPSGEYVHAQCVCVPSGEYVHAQCVCVPSGEYVHALMVLVKVVYSRWLVTRTCAAHVQAPCTEQALPSFTLVTSHVPTA